jgi:hypothetical protein
MRKNIDLIYLIPLSFLRLPSKKKYFIGGYHVSAELPCEMGTYFSGVAFNILSGSKLVAYES